MSKILITGYKGFIGTALCKQLDELNFKWVGYDLKDGNDTRNKYQVDQYFQFHSPTKVIHLAARAGVRTGQEFPEEFITTNIIGTQNLIECSKKYNIEHFIFFSSSSVYGNLKSPNKEESIQPLGIYGATKATGEMLLKSSELLHTIIRPFTVYGENGRLDQVIYKWITQIKNNLPITFYGDGTTKRGYTYVEDLVRGVIKIMVEKKQGTFNLGGNQIISLQNLLDLFLKIKSTVKVKQCPLPKGDISENWADISKAKQELNWIPQSDFNKKTLSIIQKELL